MEPVRAAEVMFLAVRARRNDARPVFAQAMQGCVQPVAPGPQLGGRRLSRLRLRMVVCPALQKLLYLCQLIVTEAQDLVDQAQSTAVVVGNQHVCDPCE